MGHRQTHRGETSWRKRRLQVHHDIERMNLPAKRRYLARRLNEVERLIQSMLYRQQEGEWGLSSLEALDTDSELWERMMDLSYLEASRQAILQALLDLDGSAPGDDLPGSSRLD